MNKRLLKVLSSCALLGTMMLSSGCGGSSGSKDTLLVWTFTDELKIMIEDYYKRDKKPDYKIDVKVFELNSLNQKLRQAMNSGKNLPDLVALEAKFVLNYIDNDILLNLNDVVEEGLTDNMYSYTKDLVTVDGNCYALSWQATPGGFFYRTDLAQKHLGVSSPEEIQEKISSWERFLLTAKELKEKGVKMVSSTVEPVKVFLGQREQGWVDKDNNFVIDNSLLKYDTQTQTFGDYNCFDVVKTIHQAGYTNQTAERAPAWYEDMSGESVFGYFMSAWGLSYELKDNSKKAGNWGFVEGPGNFYNGGTWLAGIKSSKMKDECKDIIKYFTTNEKFLKERALESGDFMNNKKVMGEIKENPSTESLAFLGGQNHYEVMYNIAENINGNLITKYDSNVDSIFEGIVGDYAMQEKAYAKTIQGAVTTFENNVKTQYGKIITVTPMFTGTK